MLNNEDKEELLSNQDIDDSVENIDTANQITDSIENVSDQVVKVDEIDSDTENEKSEVDVPEVKPGTLEWLTNKLKEFKNSSESLVEPIENTRRMSKLDSARFKVAKKRLAEKREERERLNETLTSLNSWMSGKQNSFAWKLLDALSEQKRRYVNAESAFRSWAESPIDEYVKESELMKRKFMRRIKIGFLIGLLGVGLLAIIFYLLGRYGIYYLDVANPLLFISVVIFLSIFFIILSALFAYFRDWSMWRRRLDYEVLRSGYFLGHFERLAVEKSRLVSLHGQVQDFLKLMSLIINDPWRITDDLTSYQGQKPDTNFLPNSVDIATPVVSDQWIRIRNKALEHHMQPGWRNTHKEQLFKEIEKSLSIQENTLTKRIDTDQNLRKKLIEVLNFTDVREKTGRHFVIELARHIQSAILPDEKDLNVVPIKPDPLDGLDTGHELLPLEKLTGSNWSDYLSQILNRSAAWSPLTFSEEGKRNDAQNRSSIKSFAFIPERLKDRVDKSIKIETVTKPDTSPVEIVVRVDRSEWMDPRYVKALENLEIKTKDRSQSKIEANLSNLGIVL
jgi:hypothetical protein